MVLPGLPAGMMLLLIAAITQQAGISVYVSKISVNITNWLISVFAFNLMLGLILSFVYSQIYDGIKGTSGLNKGLTFGFLVWILSAVPNLVNSFLITPSLSI
ncbi:MAG: hypothetical protein WC838_03535, partial [Candidatus Margulisiibacteriota bacterium]